MNSSSFPQSLQNSSFLPFCKNPVLIQNNYSKSAEVEALTQSDKEAKELSIINSFLADFVCDSSKESNKKFKTNDQQSKDVHHIAASTAPYQKGQVFDRVQKAAIILLPASIELKFQSSSLPSCSVGLDAYSASDSLQGAVEQHPANQAGRVEEVKKRALNELSQKELFNITDSKAADTNQGALAASQNTEECNKLVGRVFHVDIGEIKFNRMLGKGSFGEVYAGSYKSKGSESFIDVALKVNRVFQDAVVTKEGFDSLISEARILKHMVAKDVNNVLAVTRLLDSCKLDDTRMCLVEPLYSISIRNFLLEAPKCSISYKIIYKIANQLITTLAYFQCPDLEIVHFDLKPENILLEHPRRTKLRIIDFGSAKHVSEFKECQDYLVSRFYRAPEVCLSLPYTYAVDVWSVACILVELATSEPLFPADNTWELLLMIEELIGPLPFKIVQEMDDYNNQFEELNDRKGFYTFKNAPDISGKFENRKSFFNRKLTLEYRLSKASSVSQVHSYYTQELADSFKDMILSMLKWDATERLDAEQLLNHPFMTHMEKLNEQSANDVFSSSSAGARSSAQAAAST